MFNYASRLFEKILKYDIRKIKLITRMYYILIINKKKKKNNVILFLTQNRRTKPDSSSILHNISLFQYIFSFSFYATPTKYSYNKNEAIDDTTY